VSTGSPCKRIFTVTAPNRKSPSKKCQKGGGAANSSQRKDPALTNASRQRPFRINFPKAGPKNLRGRDKNGREPKNANTPVPRGGEGEGSAGGRRNGFVKDSATRGPPVQSGKTDPLKRSLGGQSPTNKGGGREKSAENMTLGKGKHHHSLPHKEGKKRCAPPITWREPREKSEQPAWHFPRRQQNKVSMYPWHGLKGNGKTSSFRKNKTRVVRPVNLERP